MTDLRAAAQQALEALEDAQRHHYALRHKETDALISTLRAALAAPNAEYERGVIDGMQRQAQSSVDRAVNRMAALAEPVQEPVAWRWGYRSITTGEMDWRGYVEIAAHPNLRSPAIIMQPLYTSPPQRKPLTDEEIDKATAQERDALLDHIYEYGTAAEGVLERVRKLCRAIERAVRGE